MNVIEKYCGSGQIEQYKKENQLVIDNLFSKIFFEPWISRNNPDNHAIELFISPKCNLGCKYCYIHRHHEKLYPTEIFNPEQIKINLKKILQWLDKKHYAAPFDIFSGEVFSQKIGWECLNIIYEYEKDVNPEWRTPYLSIPTNFSFCTDEKLTNDVIELLNKFNSIGIDVWLSASFDGLYEETNRPWIRELDIKIPKIRDNDYYDRVFEFTHNYSNGLHPMIYSQGIENWKKNFLWFQEMMEKHNVDWGNIYLLEVRNTEWTPEQIKSFQDFLEFLWEWTYNKCHQNTEELKKFIIEDKGFNILLNGFGRTSHGMPCGIQGLITVRLSDMKLGLCHRTAYEELLYGEFVDDEENILRIQCDKPELVSAVYGINHRAFSYCSQCPINHLCVGQCFGACYEQHKNMFIPIPTVCSLLHAKAATTVKMLLKYNLYQFFMTRTSPQQRAQMEWLRKEIKND